MGRGTCGWAGTNRAPVYFPSVAAASRPDTVFSVEGAPENRAGECLVAGRLSGPQLGSWDLVTRGLRIVCSPADPFDQGVVATEEVKEEPPEPFQKIGPSMRASPRGGGRVGTQEGAGRGWQGEFRRGKRVAMLIWQQHLWPANHWPSCTSLCPPVKWVSQC